MMIYLDNAAAALPDPRFFKYYNEQIFNNGLLNQEALHGCAYQLRERLKKAEFNLTQTLCGQSQFVFWNSSGSETISTACFALSETLPNSTHIITTKAEHPAILQNIKNYLPQNPIHFIPLQKNGQIKLSYLSDLIKQYPDSLIFIHHVNSETGVIQDLCGIRKIINEINPNILFIVDTIQSIAKEYIPWKEAQLDAIFCSGHKLGSPSQAALIHRLPQWDKTLKKIRHQYRSGRPEVANCETLSYAVQTLIAESANNMQHVNSEQLRAGILQIDSTVIFPIASQISSPYITAALFPNKQGAILVRMLSLYDIFLGAGSACQAESKKPSQTLTEMGYLERDAYGLLRISFSHLTSSQDIQNFLVQLATVLKNY